MNKLLILNLYYSPESFGGATIVAEQTSLRLQRDHGWSVLVVTTMRDYSLPAYFLRRYKAKGVNIIAINLPFVPDGEDAYRNPEVARSVMQIATAFQPDICHCHAIQLMGCQFFQELAEMGAKIVTTLHDCWWLCERQFMINSDGLYCNQWSIDVRQCGQCTPDKYQMIKRNDYLKKQLELVDLLLFPSEFHRRLHIANGINEEKAKVNKNGVTLPSQAYSDLRMQLKRNRKCVVFGFVGGPGFIKGADQIIQALKKIDRVDYILQVVDAAANVGASWKDSNYWSIPGELEFVPPYQQDTMDSFFAGIDVLLFPSQWKESFGLTVREALARDIWVIATDAGGVSEDLEDGVNSNIIPFGSGFRGLQSAIEKGLEPDRWKSYRNPLADQVRSFDAQALEMSQYLTALL
jgi:glycosyltransferase involved in cell wall biosynthesis